MTAGHSWPPCPVARWTSTWWCLHARSVDLHIPAGTTLALVGESGSGKSSIVQLACRFYDPAEGAVRLPSLQRASSVRRLATTVCALLLSRIDARE